ncbi:ABC transporter permease [Alkalimarinus sediminis]|uniref:FtsX-like permease family protein n=1 Tax=Alkalimarinus sediminis TaxID=1632866 RepID=A0A9E8HK60_9ALTE|nr:FtsX-like permease family protein [Alkalimarinus sediminis]UZW74178.1 FtsX-like permease family protein [Alkalimarinus sediminis]
MNLVSRLAQRNIFRNTRRTLLTVLLIGCGLAALIFTDAFIRGMAASLIKISTETFLGEAQIHQHGFREANDVDIYIKDAAKLSQTLNGIKEIKAYSPRTITGGMLSSSENVSAAAVYGVNADQEASVSKLKKAMVRGQYLSGNGDTSDPHSNSNEILIGADLAELLEVDLGDRIVVTLSQAHGGELSQELFRLSGVFHFNDRNMDKGMAFINLPKSQTMLGINGVHEISIRLQNVDLADDSNLALWQTLNNKNLETLNWRELTPQLSSILNMSGYSTLIVSIIMFVLVALGLINSMFMSIYERHNEFGILLAIGTRPQQLFWQILLEGFLIGLLSLVGGVVLGIALSYWKSIDGIDYSGMEMSGVTMNEPIYLIINYLSVAKIALSILVITVLSCIYPAIHAARLQPSFAMRKAL